MFASRNAITKQIQFVRELLYGAPGDIADGSERHDETVADGTRKTIFDEAPSSHASTISAGIDAQLLVSL